MALALGALVVVLLELALVLPRLLRVRRRFLALEAAWENEQGPLRAELERLDALAQQRQLLLRPYLVLRSQLRHPLVAAVVAAQQARPQK